jgi:hypothetical protein
MFIDLITVETEEEKASPPGQNFLYHLTTSSVTTAIK